mgnify:CR=1 FL=1
MRQQARQGGQAVLVSLVLAVASACETPPPGQPEWTQAQRDHWRRMQGPLLSPEQWQAHCDPLGGGQNVCTIQVQVDCPPDCATYKILIEDRLLRRVW